MPKIAGRFLVRGNTSLPHGDELPQPKKLLVSNVALSFWGGIDPVTGIIIDTSHPLCGECVTNTILCLPSGRGSCTASQVLLELILGGKAPAALVMRDADGLACVGAIVAQEIFAKPTLDIVCVGPDGYAELLLASEHNDTGRVLPSTGHLLLGDGAVAVSQHNEIPSSASFSEQEERMLEECTQEAERMALRVIFRYAQLSSYGSTDGNNTYIPIAQAHIDGCTYIGPGGLEFVRRLVQAGGAVRVPTTLNSVSADRQRWRALGVPQEYAQNSIDLGDAYLALGCQPSFTCAPYLLPQNPPPALGQDIAWGESNAVVFANSVLGARTEKLADYLDICCAIAGIVPKAGMHIAANRRPGVVLDGSAVLAALDRELLDIDLLFPTLGHLCGTLSDGKVPILVGLEEWNISRDSLKAFCAAFGTTASSPLVHIAGITPEAFEAATVSEFVEGCGDCVHQISLDQLKETFQLLDASSDSAVDLVAIGNPHLSVTECKDLAQLIETTGSTRKNADSRIIACMSRAVHSQADSRHLQTMQAFGVEFVFDTCWCMLLDAPIIPAKPTATILTNSGKYAHYGPGLTQRSFRFGSMSDCIRAAATGVYTKSHAPSFLEQRRQFHSTARRLTLSMVRRWR